MSGFLRAIATAASMVIATSTAIVAQSAPPKLPFAITCYIEANGSWVVGYLRDVNSDGSATYMPPGGRVSATVGADGVVEIPDDRTAASDCFGKSLDELRASGRLLEAVTKN
jgi:hypothetical protein